MITRRIILRNAATIGAAAIVSGEIPRPAFAKDTVHLLSWGWGYDKAIKESIAPRFSAAGLELEIGTNAANYAKLLAQRGNPVLSGGTFNGVFSYRGYDDKLWIPIEKSFIPNAANIPNYAFLETHGIIFGVQPYGIIYNPRIVEKPTSYLDLFNPKFQGKVGLCDYYFDGFGLTAKAMGKNVDNVSAGINEWAKHKANIGPWNQSPAQTHDLVESGELWLAFGFGGICAGAIAAGKKIAFTIPKEGATQVADVIQAITGFNSHMSDLTKHVLGLFLDDSAQSSFTKYVFTSSISKTAKIPLQLASNPAILSAQQVDSLLRPDLALSARNFADYKNEINQKLKS